jgi:hypothetical protein
MPDNQKVGFSIDHGDLHALQLNYSDSHGLPKLSSLSEGATYAEQVHALLSDRYDLRTKGIEPDGYIDQLLVQIAKEGGIDLPKFVNENRPSVFDGEHKNLPDLPIMAEELQPPAKTLSNGTAPQVAGAGQADLQTSKTGGIDAPRDSAGMAQGTDLMRLRPNEFQGVGDWVKADLTALYKHIPENDGSFLSRIKEAVESRVSFERLDHDISAQHALGIIEGNAQNNREYAQTLMTHQPDLLKETNPDVYKQLHAEARVDKIMGSNPYSAGRAGEANASGQVDKMNMEASRNAPRARRMS